MNNFSNTHLAKYGFATPARRKTTAFRLVDGKRLKSLVKDLDTADQEALVKQSFSGKSGQIAWLSGDNLWIGWNGKHSLQTLGSLPFKLPDGFYRSESELEEIDLIGWGLGSYQFDRYKKQVRSPSILVASKTKKLQRALEAIDSTYLARDLINTPSQDMSPADFEKVTKRVAKQFSAKVSVIRGDALLKSGCGAIHAVGRAAEVPPRLIELTWGNKKNPTIAIVGKGVTFDSGGLNIKPGGSMRQMKKDMGGAAIALGLAKLVMSRELHIHLKLLIPLAENAISGNAFRPGDILQTHKGITVEIDNTDAEGRLLLCDALSISLGYKPELIIDFATLTGAARVAVGTEISAMFCTNAEDTQALMASGDDQDDPVWPLPLYEGYEYMLASNVADITNSAPGGYAGATTAALFLKRFVDTTPWIHFDVMAFNARTRPARPEGGEAMGIRATYEFLERRYGNS